MSNSFAEAEADVRREAAARLAAEFREMGVTPTPDQQAEVERLLDVAVPVVTRSGAETFLSGYLAGYAEALAIVEKAAGIVGRSGKPRAPHWKALLEWMADELRDNAALIAADARREGWGPPF